MDEKEIETFAEELAKIDPTEWRAFLRRPDILKNVLSMALHCGTHRSKTRSNHKSRKMAGKEFLQTQDNAA